MVMLYAILSQNLPFVEMLALVIAYFIAIVVAFSAHEFSHAFVAYKCGDPTSKSFGRVSLNPFKHIDPMGMLCFLIIGFGWAKPVQINPMRFKHYKRDMAFVSLAGVFTNIVLAFIFSGVYFFTFTSLVGATNAFLVFVNYLLVYLITINIALCVFNLLPIYPLDGFNFLSVFMKPTNKFLQFMVRYGSIIMLILIITPIFDFVYDVVTDFIISGFFGFWGLFV